VRKRRPDTNEKHLIPGGYARAGEDDATTPSSGRRKKPDCRKIKGGGQENLSVPQYPLEKNGVEEKVKPRITPP